MLSWLRRRREQPTETWRQWYAVYTKGAEPPAWLAGVREPWETEFLSRSRAHALFAPFAAQPDPPTALLAECQGMVQLTAVYPKSPARFSDLARFACGMAEEEAGLLAIPPTYRTWRAAQWRPHLGEFDLMAHTTVHLVGEEDGRAWVHTHGLVQFDLPEVEVRAVAPELHAVALTFANMMGQWMLDGERFAPGHTLAAPWNPERWAICEDTGGRQQDPHPRGVPVLRFRDYDRETKRAAAGLDLFLAGLTSSQ